MKKKISRMPTQEYRNCDEDLYKLDVPVLSKAMTQPDGEMNDLQENQKIRSMQINHNDSDTTDTDSEMGETDGEITKSMRSGNAQAMMKGANPNAKLEDF